MIYVPVVKKKIIAYRTNSAERTIEACHSIFLEHGNIRMNNRILEKKITVKIKTKGFSAKLHKRF